MTVDTNRWQAGSGPSLCRTVDECIEGRVSTVTVPVQSATLVDGTGTRRPVRGRRDLSEGEYRLDCQVSTDRRTSGDASARSDRRSRMELSLRFGGPATVARASGRLTLSFSTPTPVTLGFTERAADPPTVTVPQTPEGVADGLSQLSAALRTTGPERSHPSMREHPPRLVVGDELSVPDAVREAKPETGIELRLPPEMEYLFVAAPLAYYLGADVTVAADAAPKLLAPSADVDYRFRELPTFQHEVGRLFRQVFFFDTLVRDVEGESSVQKRRLRDRLDVDAESVRELSLAGRLARYFWIPDADLELPDWHFSTYAAAEPENVRCLPYLLDALSLVYLPEASALARNDLLERTLDDFYRSSHAASRPVQSVDVVDPELQAGRVHAWLAPEAPIDAFKTTPTAYENRRQYREQRRRTDSLDVTVVLNDAAMSDEHATVADIYRDRAADLPLSVTVRERLPTNELADVFATPTDFVHYIGHCEQDGLACPDGTFDAATLDTSRARTFFLNACGSYHQGLELVERGSVAGAVTLTKVLDEQAAKVGTAFARLLVHGFGFEPAMQLSRRRIMMGKDYAVVGDGTYTLTPATRVPIVGRLESRGPDTFHLACEAVSARQTGDTYRPPFSEESYLCGTTAERTLNGSELAAALAQRPFPVIYEGEFHWSEALADVIDE